MFVLKTNKRSQNCKALIKYRCMETIVAQIVRRGVNNYASSHSQQLQLTRHIYLVPSYRGANVNR